MIKERRQVPRHVANMKGGLRLAGETSTHAVVVEDLCVFGCSIDHPPSMTSHQDCELTVDWEGHQFRTQATVAWIKAQGKVGLKFHDTDEASQAMLRKLCAELRMKPLVRFEQKAAG